MAKISAPKQHNVPTTNFVINLDKINLNALQEKYQLFTLEVPDSFRFSPDKNKFAKIHTTYKEHLDFPYYYFTYANPKPTIFILVEKPNKFASPISLTFDFLKDEKVTAQEKSILDLCTKKNLPILAKLFLSSWYHKAHRTCQGDFFYIHSKDDKQKLTVLLVKIQESKGEFEITSKATYLRKLDNRFDIKYINFHNYFEQIQGTRYLRQLKQSEVMERIKSNRGLESVFRDTTTQDIKNLNFKPQRPSIKWYDSKNFQGCRSELLRNFQNELVAYYNEAFGEGVVQAQNRFMKEIIPMKQPGDHTKKMTPAKGYGYNEKNYKGTGLYLNILESVGVLDLRQKGVPNPNQNNFQDYIDLLNKQYGKEYDIIFSEIKIKDLASTIRPVLVLQDVEKQLFDEGGFLLGYDDQKRELYQEFAQKIPMQTLNINLNEASDYNSVDTYFNYIIFKFEDYKYRLDVCLNELLLKKYIINKLPVIGTIHQSKRDALPCIFNLKSLTKFSYMHQNIFMYADDEFILRFLNLDNPDEKKQRNNILKNWGIDWFTFDKQFAERNYTRQENGQNKTYKKSGETKDKHEETLKKTHFVFEKDLILAIEDTEERVLFNTDATKTIKSQRITESKTVLEGIYFSESESIYTVGVNSMDMSMDKSIKVRRLYYYQKPHNFKVDDLLQTLSVQFVRNKQYTVYPYFFDLIRLFKKDIKLE
jgi:hypothetical protein